MNIHSNSEKMPLKDAATVILVREEDEKPFEVFLMQRHKKQSFMGGAFVFPGGALDAADCDDALMQHMTGVFIEDAVNRLNESETPRDKAMGLYFTAVRETFEESGILLADLDVDTSRNFAGRFNGYREEIHDGVLTLKDLAVKENIRYALNLLMPYARWRLRRNLKANDSIPGFFWQENQNIRTRSMITKSWWNHSGSYLRRHWKKISIRESC